MTKNRIPAFRPLRMIIMCGACSVLMVGSSLSQNPFEEAVKQLSSDNIRGYLQPFVNGFGANMNSGLYHTAEINDLGFHVQFQAVAMGVIIGDAEKAYNAVPPAPFSQTPVQTATVFGDLGATATGPGGLSYHFQNGQVRTAYMPSAIPQMVIGDIAGTQAVVRYVPLPELQDLPKITVLGVGLRHSISRYIPESPVDLAVGVFYERLTIGDVIDAKAMNVGAQVSKSFSLLTLYGGVQYETATMSVNYTYTGPGSTPNTKVNMELESENKHRMTGGLSLNLFILNLNADISIGKVTAVSAGVGLGL